MINKVILVGNVGRDPEVRHLESGSLVGRFSLATNENYRDKGGEWQTITEWHNVVVWRQLAERAESSIKKGMLVYIEGKLNTRKWTDKDGIEKYSTDVVANIVKVLDRKDNSTGGYSNNFPGEDDERASLSSSKESAVFDLPGKSSSSSSDSGAQDFSDIEDDLPF